MCRINRCGDGSPTRRIDDTGIWMNHKLVLEEEMYICRMKMIYYQEYNGEI